MIDTWPRGSGAHFHRTLVRGGREAGTGSRLWRDACARNTEFYGIIQRRRISGLRDRYLAVAMLPQSHTLRPGREAVLGAGLPMILARAHRAIAVIVERDHPRELNQVDPAVAQPGDRRIGGIVAGSASRAHGLAHGIRCEAALDGADPAHCAIEPDVLHDGRRRIA